MPASQYDRSVGARPRTLVLSAYSAASHRHWQKMLVRGLAAWDWTCLELPARHFSWRIRGNPLSWWGARELGEAYDCILATSTVDLATLIGMNPSLGSCHKVLYFHENQFAYPESPQGQGRLEPLMVNLYAAMAADRLAFNSEWNLASFLSGVAALLVRFPDRVPPGIVDHLAGKAVVLPVPLDGRVFPPLRQQYNWCEPHIVWNHRWEYDKGPERLLAFVQRLSDQAVPFRLSVVGQQFRRVPPEFDRIREIAGRRVIHWGHLDSRAEYCALLGQADLVLSTALHDFQGLGVMEGMAGGCIPWVPDRLAYPEYVPEGFRYTSYDDGRREGTEAADRLMACLARWQREAPSPVPLDAYEPSRLLPRYARLLTGHGAEFSTVVQSD